MAQNSRPLILLSNDDGVTAAGILALQAALEAIGDVVVCAPHAEQSAKSHAITLDRPLRLRHHGQSRHSVDGTPVDCVYVALHHDRVLPRRPDIVVSGLNHGLNLGNDIFYSGTVAAAREGALRGIPSVALSASSDTDRDAACRLSARIVQHVLQDAPGDTLLNVNFPAGSAWRVVRTQPGRREYGDGVDVRADPRGGEYLWIGSGETRHGGGLETDTGAFDAGLVGITPVSLELWAQSSEDLAARIAREVSTSEP